jgi:cell division protein FtsL
MRKNYKQANRVSVINQPLFSRNILLFVIFLTVLALAYLIQRNSVKSMLMEITKLESKLGELVDDNRNLQREMYRLSANELIRSKAINDLKMVEPEKRPEIVYYQDENQMNKDSDMLSELIIGPRLVYENPNSLISKVGE